MIIFFLPVICKSEFSHDREVGEYLASELTIGRDLFKDFSFAKWLVSELADSLDQFAEQFLALIFLVLLSQINVDRFLGDHTHLKKLSLGSIDDHLIARLEVVKLAFLIHCLSYPLYITRELSIFYVLTLDQ